MKFYGWILLSFSLYTYLVDSILNPEEFPNLLAGTFTDGNRFSTGNTLPLVGRPWGFNHWSPQTKEAGRFSGSWWFSGNDHTLTWIRCTHQPSPWIGDWGYFFLTPQMGNIDRSPIHEWQSRGALLKPYIMDITLAPKNIRFELTPTDHAAIVRVTFPQQSAQLGAKYVCFANLQWSDYGKDNSIGGSYISGKTSNVNSDRMLVSNFALYMKGTSLEANEVISHEDLLCFHYPAHVTTAIIRIGTSLISAAQVNTNLQRELPAEKSFDEICLETKSVWNK
jgi:putative alpha-1,2-mannosidase